MPDVPAAPAASPSDPPSSLALAADFPTPDRDAWRSLVSAVLAKSGVAEDADPEQVLSHRTYDGITIRPLYTADDAPPLVGAPGVAPFVRGAVGLAEDSAAEADPAGGTAAPGWDVRTRHADSDPARTNAAVLNDLETGATSLWLVLGERGLAISDLPAALAGVYLDLAPVVLDAGADTAAAADALLALAADRDVAPHQLAGSLGADPIGALARDGAEPDLAGLAPLAAKVAGSGLRTATVDAGIYHRAGASDAQEIGIATAVGVAYLRAMVDGGLEVDAALAAIDFRFTVTAQQFPSVAKLRAARRIWDRVAELSGAAPGRRGQYQHAVTAEAVLTRRDPWVNLLRGTIGCFAAAVGGADAITVLPFDHALGRPDDFSRRIARNTSTVLHDESSLARVADPAGGSWFVESLTDELAAAAWTVFTGIERDGGVLAVLRDGRLEAQLAEVREARAADIAHRRAPLTGVSEFAFVDERPVEREPWPTTTSTGLLPQLRYADAFEQLRDRADAQPERPVIFLATLGPAAVHSGRSGFAANLFQAGGLRCVTGPVEEFAQSGAKIACLCSSDKVYADEAAPAAAALREAGASRIWLAGKGEHDGIDGTIFAGCDAVAVLTEAFDELGVSG